MDRILETAVIKDEQVGRPEGPADTVGGIVHSGLSHGLEEVVVVDETHSMAGADGGVVKGLVQENLVDAGWASPAGRTSCLSRNSSQQSTVTARATRPYRSRVLERRC